jgi:hypothetical protein
MDPLGIEHFIFNEEPITHENAVHNISFTKALKLFPPIEGISPQNGKLLYYSEKLSPFILSFFVITLLMLFWGFFSFQSKTEGLIREISAIENRINHLNSTVSVPPKETDYMTTLKFIDTLFHNQHLPSYKDIITDISMGIFPATIVERLQIDYGDKIVHIKLNGIIQSDFDAAYKAYQLFLSSLQKDGYAIDSNRFNTRIDVSRFDLSLSRSIK